MFCKWCGADITASASKCTRCGRDIQPLSDCGGFYDLVPGARRTPERDVPKQDSPQKPDPLDQSRSKASHSTTKSGGKSANYLLVLLCVCFVLLWAFAVKIQNQIETSLSLTNQTITDISAALLEMKDAIVNIPEETTAPPVEEIIPVETSPEEPLIEKDDIEINIAVYRGEAGTSIESSVGWSSGMGAASGRVVLDKETSAPAAIEIDFPDASKCIVITIENEEDPLYSNSRSGRLSVECTVDNSVFAEIEGDMCFEWKYRNGATGEWVNLDESIFTPIALDTKSTLIYALDQLDELFVDGNDFVEFQLTVTRENSRGGTLTIDIEGIIITKSEVENNTNLYY